MTRDRADEYRRRAQECLDFARKISLERDRAVILEMAQGWLRLAEEQETQGAVIQPPVAERPQAAAQQQHQVQPKDDDKKE